ncbi:hypothetical protein L0F63_006644, partial [Massospora cicadina]
ISEFQSPEKGPKKLLLRVYGIGAEQFVDRNNEIAWLSKLSTCNVGPTLLGIFGNGRIEEFLESETLTHEDIINHDTSIHIAKRMSDLHNIAKIYPPSPNATPDSGELVVVDFEYAGYSLAAFDIANHFCEWMANYHCDAPHFLNLAYYPNLEQRTAFLRAYLEAQRIKITDTTLGNLSREVERLTLASHLQWGLWGIIQASSSAIEFNYMAYGTQRLRLFLDGFDSYV